MSGAVAASVVLSNLAYVAGAVVVMVVLSLVVVLRSRKPRSVEANVESFSRGLRALAPSDAPVGRHARRREPSTSRAVQVVGRGAEQTGADPG